MTLRTAQILRRFAFEEWGGTETVVWNSVHSLRCHDTESEILCTKACAETGDETRDGIRIHRFDYFYPNFPMGPERKLFLDKKGGNPYSFPLKRYLERTDFDLYHIHTAGRLAQFVRMAALKKHKPYLITFHGGQFDVPESETKKMLQPLKHTFPYGGIADRIFGWRKDFLSDASALICVGENELAELRKRYPGKHVEYLPNGVHPELYRRDVSLNIRKKLGIPNDRFLMLCVSRIDYQKNQKMLLKIAEAELGRGGNPHILLIGPITAPNYYLELRREAKEKNLENRLTVIPGTEPGSELMRAAYRQSDVFILPSLHEPFGIVVLEAWSARIPVVASNVGGLAHLLRNRDNGFLCACDKPDSFENALHALENPEIRAASIAKASVDVEAYSWENIGKRLFDLYENILSREK